MEEADDQHIGDLFNTHFVQSNLPTTEDRRYSIGDACNSHSLLQSMSTEEELQADAAKALLQAEAKVVTAPAGYDELPGKCTGHWIENWADGHYAHYGEDHHIDGLDDCADMCDQHPECAGFYTKNGKCSHWRSGSISANPNPGHMCYRKEGGAAES